jgi:DNA-binding CsgD family transcriptional regulator
LHGLTFAGRIGGCRSHRVDCRAACRALAKEAAADSMDGVVRVRDDAPAAPFEARTDRPRHTAIAIRQPSDQRNEGIMKTAPSSQEVTHALPFSAKSASDSASTHQPASLTPRERHVLALIGQGLSSAAVARMLGVSKRTVDFHLDNVYVKFGVRHRMGALLEAARRGISLDEPHESS